MSTEPRRLTDPRGLRAVAHPLRLNILEQLAVHGPMTATELGERLGESASNCSWHLRTLARHGFVTEADGGTGRQRPWQVTQIGMRWDEADEPGENPDLAVAGLALTRLVVDREVGRLLAALEHRPEEPKEWREASGVSQSTLWLTAEELAEVNQAVTALLMDKRERLEHPELRPDGSRLCALMAWGVPNPDHTPAAKPAADEE
jgi:DNA-binding transcriptional ArsR family regulator